MSSKVKIRLLAVFSIILLCCAVTIKELQNDTFYMIKLGDFIFHNGVDLVDHYSWVADLAYTYPHWLYDLFIYIVYNGFGFDGVYVSSMIFFIILILSVYIINLKFNKNELMASIVSIVTIPCLIGFVTARAQLVTIILFLWEIYFIERLISCGNKKFTLFLKRTTPFPCFFHIRFFTLFATIIARVIFAASGRINGRTQTETAPVRLPSP